MSHTLETLKKYSNEKQLFYCKDDGRLLSMEEVESKGNAQGIYPVLRTSFDVGADIPFNEGYTNKAVAKSLWAICAGAVQSSSSETGWKSFDELPCMTPRQIEEIMNERKEKIASHCIPELLRIHEATRQYLGSLKEKDFNNQHILNMAATCIGFEKSMEN